MLPLMQNVSVLILGLHERWKTSALSLCIGIMESHRSSRYYSGNWVTSHTQTILYINITGGHLYKGGGCIQSHVGHFPPCTIEFQQEHKRHPSMQKTQAGEKTKMRYEPSEQDVFEKQSEQNGDLRLRWRIIPSSEPKREKLIVFQFQLNHSYLHHNVKGVLVEKEHKKQTEKLLLFPVSRWSRGR